MLKKLGTTIKIRRFINSIFSAGLTRTFFVSFLVISIIPLLIISYVSFTNSQQTLLEQANTKLTAIATNKRSSLKNLFTSLTLSTRLQAELQNTVSFIRELSDGYKASSKTLNKYTVSFPHALLVDRYSGDIKHFQETNQYGNVILSDKEGNILYASNVSELLGKNVFNNAAQVNSKIGESILHTINTGRSSFSDFIQSPKDKNKITGFLSQAIINNQGERIGALTVPVPIDRVNNVLEEHIGLGATGKSYLVGLDLLMRSQSRFKKESTALRVEVNTTASQLWLKKHKEKDENLFNKGIFIEYSYPDYRDVLVQGDILEITLANIPYALITEIDTAEIFAPTKALRDIIILITVITAFVVMLIALIMSTIFVKPIRSLSGIVQKLSTGNMQIEYMQPQNNEIGILYNDLQEVIQTTNEITSISKAIALGDYSRSIRIRSDEDELGFAINQMIDNLNELVLQANAISKGDYDTKLTPLSEKDTLSTSINRMTKTLRLARENNKKTQWFSEGQNQLSETMRGDLSVHEISQKILQFICPYVDAKIGAVYYTTDDQTLNLSGSFAYSNRKSLENGINYGDGIVGQCAIEKTYITLENLPENYFTIQSGLGSIQPKHLIVVPFLYDGNLSGIIELGFLDFINQDKIDFLTKNAENIGIVFNSALSRDKLDAALKESTNMALDLKEQQEELQAKNEEMAEQTDALKQSEAQLKEQSEELRTANEELEEKTEYLSQQKENIELKNVEIEKSRQEIEQRAIDLAQASKYKSEFLANMSHELRTPLNSLLILAESLAENEDGNLTEHQVQSANIIHGGGKDLLTLINDILDLSKVEAGKLDTYEEDFSTRKISDNMLRYFSHIAETKQVEFDISISPNVPEIIHTDRQRVEQIIRNLLSNAFKFTPEGSVRLNIYIPGQQVKYSIDTLTAQTSVAFSIIDTGIGIPQDKLTDIFDAFQQADGGTSRKYGGTGLGLKISKEMSRLLGGEVHLQSNLNEGSSFTLYLPLRNSSSTKHVQKNSSHAAKYVTSTEEDTNAALASTDRLYDPNIKPNLTPSDIPSYVTDDRPIIDNADKIILVIEDDINFANILVELSRKNKFACITAGRGRTGIELANFYQPDAILLDLGLPDLSGHEVLKQLKDNVKTRHIPVHVISSANASNTEVLQSGAIGFTEKPTSKFQLNDLMTTLDSKISSGVKSLLVIEDDVGSQKVIGGILQQKRVDISYASTGQEAVDKINSEKFDCIILDITLPDFSGFDVLDKVSLNKDITLPPVIVYTGKELTKEDYDRLNKFTNSIVIKGVSSSERLLDETALFLHSVDENLRPEQKEIIGMLHDPKEQLEGRNILLVDDDIRNTFALSTVLQKNGINIILADNGQLALEKLAEHNEIELVLMDIMMPVMNGYEAIEAIRKQAKFKDLPIIALTAKAMPEDREKCLNIGANDYLTKPVDVGRLLSLIRVWLYEQSKTA